MTDGTVVQAVLGGGAVLVTGAYLLGTTRTRWRSRRTLSFVVGCALVLLAICPPLMHWAHQDLRGHMVQHLLLGMVAPLALVLGAPFSLLLRTLPQDTARRLVAFLEIRPATFLTHPVTALVLNIGGMYALYLTPLYALSMSNDTLHLLVHLHFVLAGYLFCWAIAGPDPARHRPRLPFRLGVLFLAIALHGLLAKLMYGFGHPRAPGLAMEEVRAAAQWMYYGGDLAEVLLAVVFFRLWFAGKGKDGTERGSAGARVRVDTPGPLPENSRPLRQRLRSSAG